MSARLTIDFTPVEGAIIRIIGLIERRGFDVRGLVVGETGGETVMTVEVSPRDATRQISVLIQHISKLIDVRQVSSERHPAGANA